MKLKTTEELTNEITDATDIEDYLSDNRMQMVECNLPDYLNLILSQQKLSRAEVVRGSLLDRAYVYQIFSGEKTPSRDKLLALAFGLKLSSREACRMLKISGNRDLYARDKRDALILFALQKNKSIFEVNDLLFRHHLATLGTPKPDL